MGTCMASFKQLREKREGRSESARCLTRVDDTLRSQVEPKSEPKPSETSASQPEIAIKSQKVEPLSESPLTANQDVQLRSILNKGRGLYWAPKDARKAGRGTTLLRLQPEVVVPSSENLTSLCHRCFSSSQGGGQRCSGCKVLRYCSSACQRADWLSHRQECKALQAMHDAQRKGQQAEGEAVSDPGMMVRLMARIIWDKQRLDAEWSRNIDSLQTDREKITSDASLTPLPTKLAQYICAGEASQESLSDLGFRTAGDLLDLVSRVSINAIITSTSDLTSVGLAISTTAAMINHSCNPNVCIVWPNGPGPTTPLHVVAIKDLEPGDELSTAYIDSSDPTPIRQLILSQRYGFQCECGLCMPVSNTKKRARVDARDALWCGRSGCLGWVGPLTDDGKIGGTCTRCKKSSLMPADEVSDVIRAGKEMLEKVTIAVNRGAFAAAMDTATPALLEKLTEIQPPSAHPLFGLLRQLQTALIFEATASADIQHSHTMFEEAVRFGFLIVSGMQAANNSLYCQGHPVRAIALATLSTLMMREVTSDVTTQSSYLSKEPPIPPPGPARDQMGLAIMVQAIDELKIAYGIEEEGGEPGRKLLAQVREWKENEAMLSRQRMR